MKIEISGKVTTGAGKASRLGFPTINIEYIDFSRLPKTGIYAGELTLHGKKYGGAICLGPRLEDTLPKLEIHCFERINIHTGEKVSISFLEKISDFITGTDEKIDEKIAEDISKTKLFLRSAVRVGYNKEMRRFLLLSAIVGFLFLFHASSTSAATYYVDGACSSSGNGTTIACGANGPKK